ncbi:MAG: His/Gly/Thr/Pro-type tRNA ligase C-terminal domain-containing protein [Patescibacteria group bacterium]
MTKKSSRKAAPDSKFVSYKHLDKIGEIAIYYGFIPDESPEIKKADFENAKGLIEGDFIDDHKESSERVPLHVEEKIALLRMFQEKEMNTQPLPILLYFKEPFRGQKKSAAYHRYCDLEILGTTKSVAEATLIQTARAMLTEEGFNDTCIEINSIGDKESMARYTRELTNYYRKHLGDMHPECRQLFKKDPFELLSSRNPHAQELNEHAPKSLSYLSEQSRAHFKEILEYMEALGIPYQINNYILGNRKYCCETIFEIVDTSADKKNKSATLAVGVRYDGLSKRLGTKREIPGVGLSLLIKGNHADLRKEITKTKKPIISFIQLGFEAKLLSLKVIEALRQAKIPVHQALSKDKLGAQVTNAEKFNTPYTIIMGKKEAMEQSVILRETLTRSQQTVYIKDLPTHMKKLDL